MFNIFNQHLQNNNVLAPEQCGFRKGITIKNVIFTPTVNILTALINESR